MVNEDMNRPLVYGDLLEFRTTVKGDITEFKAELKNDIRRLDQKIDGLDEKFNQLDGKFNQLDGKFDQLDDRFNQLDGKFNQLDDKFIQLDGKFDGMAMAHANLCGYVYGMEYRIAQLVTKQHHEIMRAVLKFASDVERIDRAEVVLRHRVDKLEAPQKN